MRSNIYVLWIGVTDLVEVMLRNVYTVRLEIFAVLKFSQLVLFAKIKIDFALYPCQTILPIRENLICKIIT